MNNGAIKVRKRPVAMFAFAVFIGCVVSMHTAIEGTPLTILWLPTSIVLVGLLTRGPSVLLPGAIGLLAATWIVGFAGIWPVITGMIAVVAAPWAAYSLIQRLRARRRAESHLVQTVHLFAAIAFVQAPLSAILIGVGCSLGHESPEMSYPLLLASHWLVESTTGIIFVRGIMVWMPDDGSGFCPVAGMSRGRRQIDPKLLTAIGLIGSMYAAALLLDWWGQDQVAQLLIAPVFFVAATTSLISNRRTSSTALMMAAFAIASISSDSLQTVTEPGMLVPLARVSLLLLTGGILLHLLNALAEERLAQQRRLRRKAFANEVTNLPNLRALNAYLSSPKLKQRLRHEGLLMAEVFVTGLMRWADIAGRTSIMKVEREIGDRLNSTFGKQMRYLIHVGTGRFIFVLERAQSNDQIRQTMQLCFQEHQFSIAGNLVRLHCSIGVVDVPPGKHNVETVLASLSIAQQKAASNSDRYLRLTLDDKQVREHRENLAWVEYIRQLLATDRICLYAQPIAPARMNSESPLHFEVLARMTTKEGRILTPDRFLPAISMAGLQVDFDRSVVGKTLQYLYDHPDLLQSTQMCAINVTGLTICDGHFPQFLIQNLSDRLIDPAKIAIEITESDAITDFESALANIGALDRAGISIAVDDFGTGQATFDYIRRMRPGILKIDGAFVRNYANDPLDKEIVESIVRLARVLGAKTVAEFIETEQMASDMQSIGVDYLQGWAIAKPMPIESIKAYCDSHRADMRSTDRTGKALERAIGSSA